MNLFLLVYSYTEWRRLGLPSPNLRELADEANRNSAGSTQAYSVTVTRPNEDHEASGRMACHRLVNDRPGN